MPARIGPVEFSMMVAVRCPADLARKRPPRKRKAAPLEGPAIVTTKRNRRPICSGRKRRRLRYCMPLFRRGSAAKHTARGSTSHCSAARQ